MDCESTFERTKGESPINNAYLVGQLLLASKSRSNKVARVAPSVSKQQANPPCVECNKPADVGCKQCSKEFCDTCFVKVHSRWEALRCHTKVSVFQSMVLFLDPNHEVPQVQKNSQAGRRFGRFLLSKVMSINDMAQKLDIIFLLRISILLIEIRDRA